MSTHAYSDNDVITATKDWLEEVIIGLNFCPFAKKEFVNDTIDYHVSRHSSLEYTLSELAHKCARMEKQPEIETCLMIYPDGFKQFETYLILLDSAEQLLSELGFDGTFQLASFHPDYYFDGVDIDDASNYTNRSPFPMLHIIREEGLSKVLDVYKDPEKIPEDNIKVAREKGADYFEAILKRHK